MSIYIRTGYTIIIAEDQIYGIIGWKYQKSYEKPDRKRKRKI